MKAEEIFTRELFGLPVSPQAMGLNVTEKSSPISIAVNSHIPSMGTSGRLLLSKGFTFMADPVKIQVPESGSEISKL